MSHFTVLVLVPPKKDIKHKLTNDVLEGSWFPATRGGIEEEVRRLLAPYDENHEEETSYEINCGCVGMVTNERVHAQLEKEGLTIGAARDKFHAENALVAKKNRDEKLTKAEEKQLNVEWHSFLEPYKRRREELTTADPDHDKADPKCEDCHGTGKVSSTYNKQSKWDWWVIGGRWTGLLDGYDPSKDPRNYEPCWLCKDDVGFRTWERDGKQIREPCNGCSPTPKEMGGPGTMRKFHNEPRTTGDWVPVKDLFRNDVKKYQTFAVVTPDGTWHQQGEMGWWAIVSDEKDEDQWTTEFQNLLQSNMDCMAVLVDCHI